MAIEDTKQYTLSGKQIKNLAEKVENTYTKDETGNVVLTSVEGTATQSADQVKLRLTQKNLDSGAESTKEISITPVSESNAGVMTPSNLTKLNGAASISVTSSDPGEGQPLAANNFIFVYE